MSNTPSNLEAADFDLDDNDSLPVQQQPVFLGQSISPYRLRAGEQLRGVANRIIFSRYYIFFYFVMMSLSLTTVVISLIATGKGECPPVSWHVLEVIVNVLMVLEVSTRWIAYGKRYPMTLLNIVDLLLVIFCSITLLLVFVNPCGEGTRQEEVLDTILLVIRNGAQFLRLGNILRRSGHSIFSPPKPIDLTQARASSVALDMDLDMDDEEAAERTLAGYSARVGSRSGYEPLDTGDWRGSNTPPRAQAATPLTEEDEDTWARLS